MKNKATGINDLFTPFQQTTLRMSLCHRILHIEEKLEEGKWIGSDKIAKEKELNLSEELLSDFNQARLITKKTETIPVWVETPKNIESDWSNIPFTPESFENH